MTKQSNSQLIHILSDSQTAPKTLASYDITLELAWGYLEILKILANRMKVTLVRVPGNMGIPANKFANKLTRKGTAAIFTVREPVW